MSKNTSKTPAEQRSEWEEIVSHPGKFEGCNPWIPYFWEAYLNGCASEDYGRTLAFDVDETDRTIFPELEGVERVYLWESDSGFVYEAGGPGGDDFESNGEEGW